MLHEDILLATLARSASLMAQLRAVRALGLQDAYLAAGVVRSTFWAARHGGSAEGKIGDLDVVFFDRALASSADRELALELGQALPGHDWEVTNQAHVHGWYASYAGVPLEPLVSTIDGISRWPETATCVGIRLAHDDRLELAAPHGLDDLLAMRWCRNPRCPDPSAFARRLAQKQIERDWPLVTVVR